MVNFAEILMCTPHREARHNVLWRLSGPVSAIPQRNSHRHTEPVSGGLSIQIDIDPDDGTVNGWLVDDDDEMVEDSYAEVRTMSATQLQRLFLDDYCIDIPVQALGDPEDRVGFVTGVELPDELRGSGLGKRLVDAVFSKCISSLSAQRMFLVSVHGSVGFWEKMGFSEVEWPGFYSVVMPLMVKGGEVTT